MIASQLLERLVRIHEEMDYRLNELFLAHSKLHAQKTAIRILILDLKKEIDDKKMTWASEIEENKEKL